MPWMPRNLQRCIRILWIPSATCSSANENHTMFISKWCKNINLGGCSGAWLPSALPSSDGCSFRASVLSTLKEIRPINLGNSGISSACWRLTSHTSDTDANVPWISLDHKFEVMDEIMFRSHLGSLPKTPNHQPFEPLIFQFPINFLGFYWWHGRWWCRLIREYRTSPGVWRSRVDWDCNAEINRNGICNKSINMYIKYSSTPSRMYIDIWYISPCQFTPWGRGGGFCRGPRGAPKSVFLQVGHVQPHIAGTCHLVVGHQLRKLKVVIL